MDRKSFVLFCRYGIAVTLFKIQIQMVYAEIQTLQHSVSSSSSSSHTIYNSLLRSYPSYDPHQYHHSLHSFLYTLRIQHHPLYASTLEELVQDIKDNELEKIIWIFLQLKGGQDGCTFPSCNNEHWTDKIIRPVSNCHTKKTSLKKTISLFDQIPGKGIWWNTNSQPKVLTAQVPSKRQVLALNVRKHHVNITNIVNMCV